jgi:alpha-methylacyl-CoA racemase
MGPLEGVTVLEIAGIGPGPFASMMLADMGANVIRVDRANRMRGGDPAAPPIDPMSRGRQSVAVDLKHPDGIETVLRLVEKADALVEGFRPGVMERLGLGPDVCLERNPSLVYGRMTGWGQEGPMAQAAGHDVNYISLAGVLDHLGRKGERPLPPLNLVGDFGGGGMLMAFGVACALVERARSGKGQVIDCAMVDGAAVLMQMMYGMRAMGVWDDARGTNLLDTGAHFYDVYETKDQKHVSIGSIEPQFYAELLEKTGLAGEDLPAQMDKSGWPVLHERLTGIFKSKTRDEWCAIMEGSDVCFSPVLSMGEAADHPHNVHRNSFLDRDGAVQAAPAPRFSRTVPEVKGSPPHIGQDTDAVLAGAGLSGEEIAKLRDSGAVK